MDKGTHFLFGTQIQFGKYYLPEDTSYNLRQRSHDRIPCLSVTVILLGRIFIQNVVYGCLLGTCVWTVLSCMFVECCSCTCCVFHSILHKIVYPLSRAAFVSLE